MLHVTHVMAHTILGASMWAEHKILANRTGAEKGWIMKKWNVNFNSSDALGPIDGLGWQ